MSGYLDWKNWDYDSFGHLSKSDYYYFKLLFKKFKLGSINAVLEVGFGNGSFLSFLKELGIKTSGVELEKELVLTAKRKGYKAYQDIKEITEKFDLIVCFDVLEHIPQEDTVAFLKELEEMLLPFGKIIIRVPNGASPLGLTNQNGDPTHVNTLTASKMAYYLANTNLSMTYSNGDIYPIYNGKITKIFSRFLKKILRIFIEKIIRFIFSPLSKGILSANAIFILEK